MNSVTPIRFPSSANLAINSEDRNLGNQNENAYNFSITKQQNILSGYFTRFAINEVVFNYGIQNIASLYDNNDIVFQIGMTEYPIIIPDGNYTVSRLMNFIKDALNAAGTGVIWSWTGTSGYFALSVATGDYEVLPGGLAYELGIVDLLSGGTESIGGQIFITNPVILPFKYIDISCPTLTYQQGLKDASTSTYSKDIIYRWNLAWDDNNPLDVDGYPIYQGYTPFLSRRNLTYPKQIKWDSQQPIGQLIFNLYDNVNRSTYAGKFEWSMNILVSEQ